MRGEQEQYGCSQTRDSENPMRAKGYQRFLPAVWATRWTIVHSLRPIAVFHVGTLAALFITSFLLIDGSPGVFTSVYAADSRIGTTLGGIRWDHTYNPCIEAIQSAKTPYRPKGPIPEPGPLVIGCTLADCGLGTDGPGSIDLRITLSGDLAQKVVLEFENIPAREAQRISTKGDVKRVRGTTRFEIGRGTSVLKGFKPNLDGRPPVAYPRVLLNHNTLADLAKAARGDDLLASSSYTVSFTVDQFRGKVSVNSYAIQYILGHCLPPPEPEVIDRIEFSSGTLPDKVLVLAPGRIATGPSGCSDYQQQVYERSDASFVPVQNHFTDKEVVFLEPFSAGPHSTPSVVPTAWPECHSEVVVYNKTKALAVVQPVTPPWGSNPAGDVVPVELIETLKVPVTLWILNDDPPNQATDHLIHEIVNAITRFTESMCGISFDDSPPVHSVKTDITLPAGGEETYLSFDPSNGPMIMRDGCDNPASGKPCLYVADSLNVYLVKYIQGAVGFTSYSSVYGPCARNQIPRCDNFGDMIFLVPGRKDDTLAHEFGHTMELEGQTGVDSLSTSNLMWEYGRTGLSPTLTKGQCYRSSVDEFSYLNSSGVRPAGSPVQRNCPVSDAYTDQCPRLSFDR